MKNKKYIVFLLFVIAAICTICEFVNIALSRDIAVIIYALISFICACSAILIYKK